VYLGWYLPGPPRNEPKQKLQHASEACKSECQLFLRIRSRHPGLFLRKESIQNLAYGCKSSCLIQLVRTGLQLAGNGYNIDESGMSLGEPP